MDWRPTCALQRAVLVGALGLALGVVLGVPALAVLAAALVAHAVMAWLSRPERDRTPRLTGRVDHRALHEGRGTTARLEIGSGQDVEHVTRALRPVAHVDLTPPSGVTGSVLDRVASTPAGPGEALTCCGPAVRLRARRWGRPELGAELVALTSPWAGYRFGPVELDGAVTSVLPLAPGFESRAAVPRPKGLVGVHPSQRAGAGSEFADIRPFRPGDRLRRISWRVSNRAGELYVTTSPAEQDAGVLLVVDALGDHGRSEGVDGAASSLDRSVRAASALAAHHVRAGDRIALQVIGGEHAVVRPGSGTRHLRLLQDALTGVQPGPGVLPGDAAGLRLRDASLVLVLSPMLDPRVVDAAAGLARRGRAVIAIDTLPGDGCLVVPDGVDPQVADLAWRMRLLEREHVVGALVDLGCPVVAWRGTGTLDEVLRQLARRDPSGARR